MRKHERSIVGTLDSGAAAHDRLFNQARRLRDAGSEVVWVGSGVTVEQLMAIVMSEDATSVVVADRSETQRVKDALEVAGIFDVDVRDAAISTHQ